MRIWTEELTPEQSSVPELRSAVVHLVDVHVLHLGVLEDALEPELAPDAALLVAAERRRDREEMIVVDPHRAGPHPLGDLERLRLVARPDRPTQAVDGVVRHPEGLVGVLVTDDDPHGAEDLLLRD